MLTNRRQSYFLTISKMLSLLMLLLLGMVSKTEALDMTDHCQWNYTVKNHMYHVEMKDLGMNCSSLYRYIPQHKMDKARGDFEVSVEVEHTDDPAEQRVNISWTTDGSMQEFLLTLRMKLKEQMYTLRPEDNRCIYFKVTRVRSDLQGQHRIYFDCIKVKTGTTKAVLETDLRAKYSYLPECKLGDINERMCFVNTIRPFSSAANVDAHCCPPRPLTSKDVQVVRKDSCNWILSMYRKGLSFWDYIIKSSDGMVVGKGNMLPTSQDDVTARYLLVEEPDTYEVVVRFWCSFNGSVPLPDYECFDVTKGIDALSCNIPTLQPWTEVFATETGSSIDESWLHIIASGTIGCVVLVAIITVIVFLLCKQGMCDCKPMFRRYTQVQRHAQNNYQINGISGGLLLSKPISEDIEDNHHGETTSRMPLKAPV